ncbi:DUF4259 domain-containing protein [Micromonospora sp. NPDC048839]|uniref:DUF4259 domain-containing protein n=1 Tax=Micromonospora sp. NPDC048839 TaxID=3155641 RepID=UPI0033D80B5D
MGTFGTGPFSSDGALDFLDELTERPPQQRAEDRTEAQLTCDGLTAVLLAVGATGGQR